MGRDAIERSGARPAIADDRDRRRRGDDRRRADVVALACHVNPDGDALGSMLGMLHVLRAPGIEVVASFPSPFQIAPHYRDLPGLDLLTPPDRVPDRARGDGHVRLRLALAARRSRTRGQGRARAHRHRPPHLERPLRHASTSSSPTAAASGVVVQRLVDAMGLPLSRDAAVCLYAALVCDTGRFQYETTTTEVFDLARRAHGVRRPGVVAVARAVRGAPLRVPAAARRGARRARARPRAAVRVDRDHPGHARAPRRHPRRGRGPHRHPAPRRRRPRSRACSRRRRTARAA